MAASVLAHLTSQVPADELYADSWTCQAVFRLAYAPSRCSHSRLPSALSPLAKQYVLRLLYAPEPIPQGTMLTWLSTGAKTLHESALKMLFALRYPVSSGTSCADEGPPGSVFLLDQRTI